MTPPREKALPGHAEPLVIRRANSSFAQDPEDDEFCVDKTRDPNFFALEPGLGVIALGIWFEPRGWKRLLVWAISIGLSTAAMSSPNRLAKYVATSVVFYYTLFPHGKSVSVRTTFALATLMRFLRVLEMLMDGEYFERRGAMYSVKFAFLYHDIRRAKRYVDVDDQRKDIENTKRDILRSFVFLLTSMGALRALVITHGGDLAALSPTQRLSLVPLIMARFYSLVTLVEAGYRLHLNLFGVRAPICYDEPWISRTVGEFWSKRWNLAIAHQLRAIFYKPLAARGYKTAGDFGVFLSSSLLHVYPYYLLEGSAHAIGSTFAYFIAQPIAMRIEQAFRLSGPAWFFPAMWATAPLVALPMLEIAPP